MGDKKTHSSLEWAQCDTHAPQTVFLVTKCAKEGGWNCRAVFFNCFKYIQDQS